MSLESYVRHAWYVAAWSHELLAGKPQPMTILGEPVVLWRKSNGAIAALEDRCYHRLAPLSLGRCEGDNLRCMYHGLLFDSDGIVREIPGQDVVSKRARVKTYPAVERHGWIWIWMADAADADPAVIPPAIGLDHPDYVLGHGQMDYAASAHLICDNLLDLTHSSYVHENSFRPTESWARARPKVTQLPRSVRIERWVADQPALGGPSSEREDAWNSYDFYVPGVLMMSMESYPPGTVQSRPNGPGQEMENVLRASFSTQVVTPMTERTSRYFYCWGPRRTHGDEVVRDALMKLAAIAFNEDRVMIEGQQRIVDSTPEPRVIATRNDAGIEFYHRLLQRLIREESPETSAAE